jgi:hypothetical protein
MNDESEELVFGLSQLSEDDGDPRELITDEEYTVPAQISVALLNRGNDDEVEIDDDEQKVSLSKGGAWVRAWLFVDD